MESFRHLIEYALLRGLSGFLCLLPYRVALGLAWCVAWLAFHVVRFRRKKALERIRSVFPDISRREAKRIAWISLRNLFFNIVELMRMPVCSDKCFDRYYSNILPTIRHLQALAEKYGGLVMALPHCGNWDLAGLVADHYGLKICAITGRQRNRRVDNWLARVRGGMVVLERGKLSDIRKASRLLREGYTMAVLPDVRMRRKDIDVPFLGGVANLGSGMARFAREAGVPIQPVVVRRETWTRLVTETLPAILPEEMTASDDASTPEEIDLRTTRKVLAAFDAVIRSTPGQWFWYNSRWVLDPVS
ncbi:MAG: lysophospholipid acyltransferase family protein [Kiritimatiellia bacterium]|jgi:lauroyl/myristoyl acyltransferase